MLLTLILISILSNTSQAELRCADTPEPLCSSAKNNREVCDQTWFRDNCSSSCGLCDCQDSEDPIWIQGGTKRYCNQVDPKSSYCTWSIFQEKCEKACGLCVPIISNTQSSTNPSLMLTVNPSSMQSSSPSLTQSVIPSSILSEIPSLVSTSTPSIASNLNPNSAPTSIPSDIPTMIQSVDPSKMKITGPSTKHSIAPNPISSNILTTIPSNSVSNFKGGLQKCKNKNGRINMGINAGSKKCAWLKKLEIKQVKAKCEREEVKTHCYKTCTVCDSASEGPIQKCKNKNGRINMGKKAGLQRCSWLKGKEIVQIKKKCKKEKIKTHCYKTCTVCDSSLIPSNIPSTTLSNIPSFIHNSMLSIRSSANPSVYHSVTPTVIPSVVSSSKPSSIPSASPSKNPSADPSTMPSVSPSLIPSNIPSTTLSNIPSFVHSSMPSIKSSDNPSVYHSVTPTVIPSLVSSSKPSSIPSASPSKNPSADPSTIPSATPSINLCKNEKTEIFMGSGTGSKYCSWLEDTTSTKKAKKCEKEEVKKHCYKSCTRCDFKTSEPSFVPSSRPSIIPSTKPTSSMSMSMKLFFFV